MGFARDCPLTVMGTLQATLVGDAMRENGISISHVYCSPSLRCIQTCHSLLKVRKFQKEISEGNYGVFDFPKKQHISALASKKWLNQKTKGTSLHRKSLIRVL